MAPEISGMWQTICTIIDFDDTFSESMWMAIFLNSYSSASDHES